MNAPLASMHALQPEAITLDDKYTLERGRVFLTGTQALIRLPMRRVEIELSGYGDDEAAAWLARFDLYFQKGGG